MQTHKQLRYLVERLVLLIQVWVWLRHQSMVKFLLNIKSTTGENLTETQKEQLKTDLQPFTVASITPVIVDPETMFLILTSNVNFDSNATTKGSATIESNVRTTITNYNTDNLNTFNGLFRHSKLVGLIDTDPSITSNTLSVSLAKFFTPDITCLKSYNLYYNNRLLNLTLNTTKSLVVSLRPQVLVSVVRQD